MNACKITGKYFHFGIGIFSVFWGHNKSKLMINYRLAVKIFLVSLVSYDDRPTTFANEDHNCIFVVRHPGAAVCVLC